MGLIGLFGKWLIERQLIIHDGEISLLNQRVAMIPVSFFVELHKYALKSKDKRFKDDLYLWAWKTAYLYIKKFDEEYGLKTFEERYRWGMDVAAAAGFGDYKTIDYKPGQYSHFYVFNNPIAQAFYPYKEPVDIMLRGINAGGGTACHLKIVNCLETECQAINGERCVFVTGTEKAHRKMGIEHLYATQIDLDYILPIQKEIIKELGWPKI